MVTSHENFGLVQELFKDLLSMFSACACAACFALAVVREFSRAFCSSFIRFVVLLHGWCVRIV